MTLPIEPFVLTYKRHISFDSVLETVISGVGDTTAE
jgi:hypothetical protein